MLISQSQTYANDMGLWTCTMVLTHTVNEKGLELITDQLKAYATQEIVNELLPRENKVGESLSATRERILESLSLSLTAHTHPSGAIKAVTAIERDIDRFCEDNA